MRCKYWWYGFISIKLWTYTALFISMRKNVINPFMCGAALRLHLYQNHLKIVRSKSFSFYILYVHTLHFRFSPLTKDLHLKWYLVAIINAVSSCELEKFKVADLRDSWISSPDKKKSLNKRNFTAKFFCFFLIIFPC